MEESFLIIEETKNEIIGKYGLIKECTTKNNKIYSNADVVLIQNMTTGELKFKRNLR